jgi:hypothetical protein
VVVIDDNTARSSSPMRPARPSDLPGQRAGRVVGVTQKRENGFGNNSASTSGCPTPRP